jgi:uncharacterized membrane protein YbhN (UPF0104 family)
MRRLLRIIPLVSLLFVTVYLFSFDYLSLPRVESGSLLGLSFLLLCAGFLVDVVAWRALLCRSGCQVDLATALAGFGLSVFGKYVPGKVWLVVGAAAYVAERTGRPTSSVALISVTGQFISLMAGLLLGTIGLFAVGGLHAWGWLAALLFCGLVIVLFSRAVHDPVERVLERFIRPGFVVPSLNHRTTLGLLPFYLTVWLLYSAGFYLLVESLTESSTPLFVGFGFPLASTLGLMVLLMPGGLGVREGVLSAYLGLAGIPVAHALALSIAARLWFTAGELFLFVSGLTAHRTRAPRQGSDGVHE